MDVALYDMAFRMIAPLLTYFDATGKALHRDGNNSLAGAPTGHFRSKEGHWLCLSVQNDEQFARCAGSSIVLSGRGIHVLASGELHKAS